MAAHSIQPLTNLTTSAIGLVLMTAAHLKGWPIPVGGSKEIANALSSYFISLGGRVETGRYIKSLAELPSAKILLFDVTPKQLLQIAGHQFSSIYKWQLERYRYGMGVFKIDWALDGPIPTAAEARKAGTVHIGNTLEEIQLSEQLSWEGKHAESPFVLLAQQSILTIPGRPEKAHSMGLLPCAQWLNKDMTAIIEQPGRTLCARFQGPDLARAYHEHCTGRGI